METSWGLLFYLKKPKNYRGGNLPVYFRITVDGIARELSTKLFIDPLKWSTSAQRLTGKSDNAKAVNDCIEVLNMKAIQARTALLAQSRPVTADSIRLLVQDKPLDMHTIMEAFDDHNKRMKELVGKDYADGTMERYEVSYRHTEAFMLYKYGVKDMDVNKIDFQFIQDYELWLKTVRKCDHNTTMKYISNFKKIVLICLKKKWLTEGNPFAHIRLTTRKKKKRPLTQNELDRLAAKKFSTDRLTVVRDIFLLPAIPAWRTRMFIN